MSEVNLIITAENFNLIIVALCGIYSLEEDFIKNGDRKKAILVKTSILAYRQNPETDRWVSKDVGILTEVLWYCLDLLYTNKEKAKEELHSMMEEAMEKDTYNAVGTGRYCKCVFGLIETLQRKGFRRFSECSGYFEDDALVIDFN